MHAACMHVYVTHVTNGTLQHKTHFPQVLLYQRTISYYIIIIISYLSPLQTLDLLFQMTNQSNVVVITDRLIAYLRQTNNEYIRSDLVAKITQLAERFAPDNQWFIQTMNAVFELGE